MRSPFVLTVAAATSVLGGCGARVETGSPATEGVDAGPDGRIEPPRPVDCPASAPRRGTPCLTNETCNYGDCDGMATETAQCVRGSWEVRITSCNPPPPVCPEAEPTAGTPCQGGAFGSCTYGGSCGENARVYYQCIAARWQRSGRPTSCPTARPRHGDECARCFGDLTAVCEYDPCGSSMSTQATCDAKTGRWVVQTASCNPPPPPVDAGTP